MLVFPYKAGSRSAKALAEGLNVKRIKHRNSNFKGHPTKTVINWGSSKVSEEVAKCHILNPPDKVAIASNKRTFFRKLAEFNQEAQAGAHGGLATPVSIPEFTTSRAEAQSWLEDGKQVVCRTRLQGHSGEGIVLAEFVEELVGAPLYTMYVPKKYEYRVHIFNGQVLHTQRKARSTKVPDEEVNWKIRNHGNGFIFAINEDHTPNPQVTQEALKAVQAVGLDFGAADVIYNEGRDKAYVLEINTACGLEGTTLEKYVEAFRGL